jgi:hypothetical protein
MRKTISLREGWRRAAARAHELGIDTPAVVEAMRNGGSRRTEANRELLRSSHERAVAAGLEPLKANY